MESDCAIRFLAPWFLLRVPPSASRNTAQPECCTKIVFFHALPDRLAHRRSMQVHLICQLNLFLCSFAGACINSISCDFPENVVGKSGVRAVSVSAGVSG